MVVKEQKKKAQHGDCNMRYANPSYPCSKHQRRFPLLESNEIESRHPQDEASCHQHLVNRPVKERTMFHFSIPKNEKDAILDAKAH